MEDSSAVILILFSNLFSKLFSKLIIPKTSLDQRLIHHIPEGCFDEGFKNGLELWHILTIVQRGFYHVITRNDRDEHLFYCICRSF